MLASLIESTAGCTFAAIATFYFMQWIGLPVSVEYVATLSVGIFLAELWHM